MGEHNHKETYEKFVSLMNDRSIDEACALLAVDCKEHTPPPIPDFADGREGFKQIVGMWTQAFPDFRIEVQDILVDGNRVATRSSWTAKHTGSMMGEEPTGKTVTGHGVEILIFNDDGLLAERWGYGDDMEVMASLGIGGPPPE